MVRRLLIGIPLILLALAAIWFFRPFQKYSPAGVIFNREFVPRLETYRAMEDVYPFGVIEGADTPIDLPVGAPFDVNAVTYQWDGQTRRLADFVADADATAILVLKDGEIVFEEYYNGEVMEDRHTSWSVAKSYVATFIGMAIRDGLIDSLDDPASKYAPQFTGTDYGSTSLRDLLMMSSGIDFNEDYDTRGSDIRTLYFNTFIFDADIDRFVGTFERTEDPGTRFVYQSPNSHVLAAVVREVYGKPIVEIASEKLYKPLEMPDATWLHDRTGPTGKAIGYCCLQTRARDYAKFGQLYLNDGVWNGQRLLPEGWTDFVSTPPTPAHEPSIADPRGYGYGMHFWLPAEPKGEFFAAGFDGQHVWIDRERNVVIVKTAADPGAIARGPEMIEMFRTIAAAVSTAGD